MSFEHGNHADTFLATEDTSAEALTESFQVDPFEEALRLQAIIIGSQDLPPEESEALLATFELALLGLSESALANRISRLKVRVESLQRSPPLKKPEKKLAAKVIQRTVSQEIDGIRLVKTSQWTEGLINLDLQPEEDSQTISDNFSEIIEQYDAEQTPISEVAETDEPSASPISPLFGPAYLDAFSAYLVTNMPPRLSTKGSDLLGVTIFHGNLASKRLSESSDSLEAGERHELEEAVKAGLAARGAMAIYLTRLVIGMSRRFAYDRDMVYSGDIRAEMVGVGNLKLVECMEKYVHTPGQHFAIFAATCVRRAMIKQMMANRRSYTGLSLPMQKVLLDIDTARKEAAMDNERADRIEIGMRLGYSKERLEAILALTKTRVGSISVDEYSMDVAANAAIDRNATKELEDAENRIMLTKIWEVASELHRRQVITDNEWRVLIFRYVQGLTQQETRENLDEECRISVPHAEQSVLEKIRKEIETPGYHNKRSSIGFKFIQSGVDLLDLLDIPVTKQTDILGTAANIINSMSLTEVQRQTMHAMIGTDGNRLRPFEVAKMRDVTLRAVYVAREGAVERIMEVWDSLTTDEKREAMAGTLKSNPEHMLTAEKILQRALELKVITRFSKKDAAVLAKEGAFFNPNRVEEVFGTWRDFLSAYREARNNL